MKRLIPLTCALMLLCATAQAATWFPDGMNLHRDPLCDHNTFSLESCFAKTLTTTIEEAQAQSYLICSHCYVDVQEAPVPSNVAWYSNPYGGAYLHRDPECPSISRKYRPLAETDKLPAGVIPYNACNICGSLTASGAYPIEHLFDNAVWNSTPEEKALMLPGMWTLPSESAIPFTDAMAIAKEYAAEYSDKTVHSAFACHYNMDPQGNPRETWKVVVATPLMHPVCIVYLDAQTGEFLGAQLSQEYSDNNLDAESP